MAYFKEKSMLAMAMKASAASTVLQLAASPPVQSCAACWPAQQAVQLANAAMPAALWL